MAKNLEDIVEKSEPNKKFSVWDFFVGAYSSSKAVKVFFTSLYAGYSYFGGFALSAGFYFACKTVGLAAKYIGNFLYNPIKNYNPIEFVNENIGSYNPFGPQRRPHFMGGALSTVTHYTGF